MGVELGPILRPTQFDLFFDPDLTLPDPANLNKIWVGFDCTTNYMMDSLVHTEFEKKDAKMELRVINCNIMKFYWAN